MLIIYTVVENARTENIAGDGKHPKYKNISDLYNCCSLLLNNYTASQKNIFFMGRNFAITSGFRPNLAKLKIFKISPKRIKIWLSGSGSCDFCDLISFESPKIMWGHDLVL